MFSKLLNQIDLLDFREMQISSKEFEFKTKKKHEAIQDDTVISKMHIIFYFL